MTDIRKSYALRGLLFVLATAVLWGGVAIADANLLRFNQAILGGAHNPAQIEGMVFIWVTSKIMWRWLSRRVWIGTAALPSHQEKTHD